MSKYTCHEDVSRKGISQPCDKMAVAYRYDPETRDPYPVCAYHCRADMVPLDDVLAEAHRDAVRDVLAFCDDMPADEAASVWRDAIHGGDTGRAEDWDDAFAEARKAKRPS